MQTLTPATHSFGANNQNFDVVDLISLAVRGLGPMFDSQRQLYCYRLTKEEGSLRREGMSPRYTIITLLGLHRLQQAGGRVPVDIKQVLESLLKDTSWVTNIGDFGLLLWLHSQVLPDRSPDWCSDLEIAHALEHYPDARAGNTMEISWFITGLAQNLLSSQGAVPKFADLAKAACTRLEKNQGPHGFFGHTERKASLTALLRASIGSFADQVYPIYAMTKLAQACGLKEPLARAVECAQAICRAQGPLGQWWWHYDSKRGHVVRQYPVFSVHQDGMAPMALFAVGEASGLDFTSPIHKGLQWIYGRNELGQDMRDKSTDLIWRCIFPKPKSMMYLDDLLGMLGKPANGRRAVGYQILFEGRPYHFGWLLYAFAPRLVSSPERSLVTSEATPERNQ